MPSPIELQSRASLLKLEAQRLGFGQVGIAKEEARRLEWWLNQNYQGEMGYMANHFDKRVDPTLLVPGAKSVVSLSYNYFTDQEQAAGAPKISRYAYGKDYHYIIKYKLKELLNTLTEQIGEINGRVFVDSAPVLERDWAKRSGVGWIGKNTMLIHPKKGSFFFLAELIIDLELATDQPIKDYCGTCTRCIDACPTDAISADGYVMDGSKCISYYTIELKSAIPEEVRGQFEDWMFGCDICQDVCPWNRFSETHQEIGFEPHPQLLSMKRADWEELTADVFRDVFKKSAVKRTGFKGLMRNIDFLKD